MEPEAPHDALARLDPSARRRAGPRLRLGVGAAAVLLIAALVVAVLVSMLGQQASRTNVGPNGTPQTGDPGGHDLQQHAPAPGPHAIIFVHVLGAVRNPGLFELHDGARVIDGVAAAGGLTETADQGGANLARILSDGEQLYIPHLGEAQPGAPPDGGSSAGPPGVGTGAGVVGGKLNLNTAGIAELDTLPRIGPAMAQRIVDYRDANGRFSSVDDLRNVTGIGDKTFEALKDLVTV